MKLKALTLENFKGISDPVRIEFSPITLLFGPNNAGKSTVLHALIYAREIFERGNIDPRFTEMGGDTVDLGGFDSLVFKHERSRKIKMRFEFNVGAQELTDAIRRPASPYDTEEVMYTDYPGHWNHRSLEFAEGHLPNVEEALEALAIKWLELCIGWCPRSQRAVIEQCKIGGASIDQPIVRLLFDEKTGDAQLTALDFGTIPFGKTHTNESRALQKDKIAPSIPFEAEEFSIEQQRAREAWKREYSDAMKTASIRTTDLLMGLIQPQFLWDDGHLRTIPFGNFGGGLPDETRWFRLSDHCYYGLEPNHDFDLDKGSWSTDQRQAQVPDWVEPRQVGEQFLDPMVNAASVGVVNCCRLLFRHSLHLSSVRVHPPRDFHPVAPLDPRRWPNGLAAWDLLVAEEGAIVEPLNEWLSGDPNRFDSGFRVEVQRVKQVDTREPVISKLLAESSDVPLEKVREYLAKLPEERLLRIRNMESGVLGQPRDVGYGLSQLVPVIVAALNTEAGVVSVEEPEANIHPAFQVVLADLFITQSKANPNTLFLIETHSEHLMLRLMRRIRETSDREIEPGLSAVKPDDVAVHFVEPSTRGPVIHRIRIDEDGEFHDWPKGYGFFRERAKELFG